MLILPGSSLFSVSKRDTLLKDIQASCPKISLVDAIYIHLVDCASKSAESDMSNSNSPSRKCLDRLLDYGNHDILPWATEATRNGHNVVFVLPRSGSISPWSSKATDIAAICNLGDQVRRLERG